VASIGMACGAGFYRLAVISTLIAISVLIGLVPLTKPLERFLGKRKPEGTSKDRD